MRTDMNNNLQDKNIRDIAYMEKQNTLVGTRQRTLVDVETGIPMEVTQVTKLRYGSKHFWKCYMKEFIDVMLSLSGKQFTVFTYIVQYINPSDNRFICTYDKIMKETDSCRQTVASTMKKLQKKNFIRKVQNGVWIINPKILMKGNDIKQNMLLKDFNQAIPYTEKKSKNTSKA